VQLIQGGAFVGKPNQTSAGQPRGTKQLTLSLDAFAWEAISEESTRLGISVEELARFSVLYYLADLNSGRVARRFPDALIVNSG
jgi:hypothetical protein